MKVREVIFLYNLSLTYFVGIEEQKVKTNVNAFWYCSKEELPPTENQKYKLAASLPLACGKLDK